jgi:tyrosinase
MTTTGLDQRFRTANRLRHRKNVARLTPDQLHSFRLGVARMALYNRDDRGLLYWASIHGGPPRQYCQHGTLDGQGRLRSAQLFLPWHRAYLYFFELALQDQEPRARVPWWDWSSPAARAEGIPRAFSEATTPRGANPLASQYVARGPGRESLPLRTFRRVGGGGSLPGQGDVQRLLRLGNFGDFSAQLEQLHAQVHQWVGGTMTGIASAAFDPIFWTHHAMVDRLWRIWQLANPESTELLQMRNVPLEPFGVTVGDVLAVADLGYDYAGSTSSIDVEE